ncbi:MAG: Ig-like domain-containing protein, partial [Acidobacteria bacterium]|nr:Ig-like domain-containing protein [Acidobacteriota bacterium]
VPLAPHLSITFSQPMVAVTSNDDLSAAQVPVKLSPQPAGKWRWLGTKTLIFDPPGRLPMATGYTVEIPAGTKSAIGGTLANTKRWTFATPQPKVTLSYPNEGPHERNPVFFVAFDQRINPDETLNHLRLSGGARDWKLRLATAEEIAADETVSRLAKQNEAGRWLAFRIATSNLVPLPGGMKFTVTIDPGMPSAEGPRKTIKPQSFSFSTYDPLALTSFGCGYDERCEPGTPFHLEFNNELDQQSFSQNQIRVTPEIPGMKMSNHGNTVIIEGATKGGVTYQVTVDASVKDVFDQTLGQSRTVAFKVRPATPALAASADWMAVVDPFGAPKFSVYTINHQQLKVTLYSVAVEDWFRYTDFIEKFINRTNQAVVPRLTFGRRISSDVVKVATRQDELIETAIDLKPVLNNGVGHVIAVVEAVQPARRDEERRSHIIWLQATEIGLDAFADHQEVLGWATSLRDGKPLGDIELALTNEKGVSTSAARTGADGLAHIEMKGESLSSQGLRDRGRPSGSLLIARKRDDKAFLHNLNYWMYEQSGWFKRKPYGDLLKWHGFDDRGMYRPGEEVKIKGWVRRLGAGQQGDVTLSEVKNLTYILRDSRGNEVLKGSARVNALGGFDTAFKLPPTMNLGYGILQ